MKIVIIGPGIMPIPPNGWGAVEGLIWDYKHTLENRFGHHVTIVNTPNSDDIVKQTDAELPDVVHIQYDNHWHLYNQFLCKNVVITSHFAYITNESLLINSSYFKIFKGFVEASNNGAFIMALSKEIANMYLKYGANPKNIVVLHNGASSTNFRYTTDPKYPERSICVGKIEDRKRQSYLQKIQALYFAGNIHPKTDFSSDHPRYLGEWYKDTLYDTLTDYANLVLLSDGEAHPLVVCEALVAGLGVVVSEVASANLDRSLPFVSIIPDNMINDTSYIEKTIEDNRKISLIHRDKIREYGLAYFSWDSVVARYIEDVLQPMFLKKN